MKALGIVFLVLLVFAVLWSFGIIGRGCDTASQMADKTIFNAEKHVYSYEEFHRKYEAYQQFQKQRDQVDARLAQLAERGITSGQEYNSLTAELNGSRQMMNRIAAEYNAMSEIAYQAVWKSRGLPDKLE